MNSIVYGVVELNENGNWQFHYEDVGRYGITQTMYKTQNIDSAKEFAERLTGLNGREHKIVSRQVTPWVLVDDGQKEV